ncbi:DUF3303 domain-containing protein [Geodermatophilus sp. SYSU D00815]
MEYVALLRFRPEVSAAERDRALVRRASWRYPDGIRPIAEYWPSFDQCQVVSVFAANTYAPVMELQLEWSDVFDISISPAISAEEGLQVGAEVLGRLPRMRQPEPAPA